MSKTWFVTGSSRGLGRCFVEAALSRNDRVAASARNTASLEELADAYGDAVLPLELDVTDRVAVFESVKRAKEHFGRLDVIVNNAGYAQIGAIEELTEQQLRDQFETNVFGAVWVIQAALPYLREQGAGHIIQMSSIGGLIAMPLGGAYQASKWSLEALNDTLVQEVADFGIKVTVVEPAGFATRSGKNPNPLANGHMAKANRVTTDSASALPCSWESSPPAIRPLRPRHSSRSSIPTPRPCGCFSARASTKCSSKSTPTGSSPGPTGRTSRWRLTGKLNQEIGDPFGVSFRDLRRVHQPCPNTDGMREAVAFWW
ncbi:SDR family NAD(P)-dependent oxidoreductase [Bradyrhizobium sp. SBR1B]|uniref:SDR family NAD(P)-dependent oxidoreductase n=1 Tax=Bradyrhizobium sp. SBR1B TaxID=2663836 RepID=UPI00179FC0DB|nr:SDR family NAD(P)-dependent oxidoreductase [Bradyrhizobium sp. SBR1B]MBB4380574.1 NAD(P)-dependent dehydrogenase (short-subunit alcohol dehydrogenase family) [Bradyrhizobium sp. SBR1B]